ncbi:MAG: hypothetical protein WBP89_15495 [Sedimenticolaceae bacterium]
MIKLALGGLLATSLATPTWADKLRTVPIGGTYSWQGGKNLDFSLGGTLYLVGDAPIDQTSQGVRVKGDFENNAVLFLGGTLRYVF